MPKETIVLKPGTVASLEDMQPLTFIQKMLELQRRIKPIIKDSDNPFFKSKYADINSILAEVKPIMSELGLVLTQPLTTREGKNILCTNIYDANSALNELMSEVYVPDNADIQKFGASVTYLRRFALVSLLSLEAVDTDGNDAVSHSESPKQASLIEYPDCPKCGAPQTLSAKGNVYCTAKCFLNEQSPY